MSEEENVPQIKPWNKKLTRRQFLKLTAEIGLTTALGGCKVERIVNNLATATPEPVTPTPYQLPDTPPASVSLKATATALETTGQQSSFREEAGYTKEIFEAVRHGTFIIEVIGEKETQEGKKIGVNAGTAWLAHSENDTYYVVTNRHVVELPEDEKRTVVKLWRPGLDSEKFVPSKVTTATIGEADISVLKLQGKYNTTNPVKAIKWEDNFLLQTGNKALIVGFPGEFLGQKSELDSHTLGSVIDIDYVNPQGLWGSRALANGGNSGSPTVINKDGQAVVIGVIRARTDLVLKNNDGNYQKQPYVVGIPLNVRELINATNQK